MRVESEDGRNYPRPSGIGERGADHLLVAQVYAVKDAKGEAGRPGGPFVRAPENSHCAVSSSGESTSRG